MVPILLGFFVILLVLGFIVVGMYNGLVELRNRFRNAFAQVDVQLKRRHDLIPNLVETAKGYMAHEAQTLTAVVEARAKATQANVRLAGNPGDPAAMRDLVAAESGLTGALGRLLVVSENYPQLKADATMRGLMEELTSTENRIAFARQAFNDSVTDYNNGREKFPASIIASMFQFQPATLLEETQPEVKNAPRVSFN